ncbi:MAG: hypothetical protein ACPHCJ_10505, partial [Oceanococcaceae bacterium]
MFKGVARAALWLGVVFCSVTHGQGTSPRQEFLDALWVSGALQVLKLDAATAQRVTPIEGMRDVSALAIDERSSLVWAFARNVLHVVDFSGKPVRNLPVPDPDLTAGLLPIALPDLNPQMDAMICDQSTDGAADVPSYVYWPNAKLRVADQSGAVWL